ncbi:hypothetical protein H9649_17230 [Sporosarcina sp. Sa2YVA2]|uniref:NlpC/P60 domain-containing protein n=1 Tax=Sporosarcina quadrami TaxID=2762234 RepID=A0ABR8UE80_9BACL|nr:hypothetical protein [Sporosarcina quadrami]MBD7986316.1 hypothetical protein [Sporosarcina quadrami]
MKIKPTQKNLEAWIENLVPNKDLFFLTNDFLNHQIDILDVLLMPIDEFFNHSTYKQIDYVNSYLYWNIKNAQYVLIADKSWIGSRSADEQAIIFNAQIECARGLVVPIDFVNELEKIPPNYIVDKRIFIQREMWENLDFIVKGQLLNKMVYEWWDNGDCEAAPPTMPGFLKPYANTFGYKQGSNCLAAVLYAISKGKQEWFIHEWVHQKTFLETLSQYAYQEYEGEGMNEGDIVIWKDKNDTVQHAAYYIGDGLYFNKHGQTIFNPWKILKEEQLYKVWEHLDLVKYRSENNL